LSIITSKSMAGIAAPYHEASLADAYSRGAGDRVALYCTAMLFFSYLFPAEAAVRIGTVITMRRVAVVACLVLLIFAIGRKLRERRYVPVVSDFFVLAFMFWTPAAVYASGGLPAMTSVLGVLGLEFAVPYFVGRVMLGNADTLRRASMIMLYAVIGMFLLGFLDTLSGENLLARIATDIFGNFRSVKFYGDNEVQAYETQYRFGLARARGPLEHSILFGLFFGIMAPLMLYNLRNGTAKLVALGVCAAGVVIALSSAPMLLFGLLLSLLAYDQLFSRVRWRWAFFTLVVVIMVVTIFAVVEDPIVAFIRGFTLDPQTGLTRLEIWHWVGQNLAISPIFGVGTRDWFRPVDLLSSIDALWLVMALQYGYVGLGLLICSILGVFFVMTPRPLTRGGCPEMVGPRRAETIAILLFILASFTVHIWGAMWGLMALVLGMRAAASEAPYLPGTR